MTEAVDIYITQKCNLNCPWCYNENRKTATMTKEVIDKIIGKIKEKDCVHNVAIVGGEPMMEQEKALYIIQRLPKTKNSITIMTNGTIDMKDFLEKANQISKNKIIVNFSYSPLNKELTAIRERNIFLAKELPNIEPVIQTVLTPERIPVIYDYIKYMEKFKIRIRVLRMHQLGDHWTDKDTEAYERILPKLVYESVFFSVKNNLGWNGLELPNKLSIYNKTEFCGKCISCQDTVSRVTIVDVDGQMYFCTGSLGRKEYSYGYFWEEKEKPNLKEFGYQDNYYNYCYIAKNKIINSFDLATDKYRETFQNAYYKLSKLKEYRENMTKTITGTDKQLYDMVIDFYDSIQESIKNYTFEIKLEKDANMIRLKEFVSLVDEIKNDCQEGECEIKFKIAKDNDEK